MKLYKLWTHQKTFSDEAIVLNPKDFPDVKVKDIIEINCPESGYSPLLVQVQSLGENFHHKDVISISQAIANIFHLRMYNEVYVNVIPPKDVALDLVELTYKEQYFSRADMWRMKKSLINSCLYLTQKITFCEMRAQVHELWSKGDKVTCGYVTEDTRVTYRSSTAQVNIFIQMSCEMWEFDNYGDLYFEKAVDGFLDDLFKEWTNQGCNHDVTITLFSRTFYDAKSIEQFPMHMRECIQRHYNGLYYEDFYRVVVQNEKYEDWTKTMIELRKLFHQYNTRVVQYHQRFTGNKNMPRSFNSSASQGNFLEVLNMSLNVYEKYFLDRCFDRTGKLSIVITPGPGVFEVDRQLATITKHRTIDCGNSSDLVCMGEQPLHVVPLFKFHSGKNQRPCCGTDSDFNIPHWINHSFYTSRSQDLRLSRGMFTPRIKMPPLVSNTKNKMSGGSKCHLGQSLLSGDIPCVDYDAYDAEVFKLPTRKKFSNFMDKTPADLQRIQRYSYSNAIYSMLDEGNRESSPIPTRGIPMPERRTSITVDDDFMSHSYGGFGKPNILEMSQMRLVAGSFPGPAKYLRSSSRLYYLPRRALFNPFTPSDLRLKVTSNRRRWAHAFPTDVQGASIQHHHKHSGNSDLSDTQLHETTLVSYFPSSHTGSLKRNRKSSYNSDSDNSRVRSMGLSSDCSSNDSLRETQNDRDNSMLSVNKDMKKVYSSGTLSLMAMDNNSYGAGSLERDGGGFGGRFRQSQFVQSMNSVNLPAKEYGSVHRDLSGYLAKEDHIWGWGITGEQEWTPDTRTGVDWKSMTIPASLPITTDYFPDKHSLENDYIFRNYTLLPDDVNSDTRKSKPLTTVAVYREMVAQRLAQGFQLVLTQKPISGNGSTPINSSPYQTSSLMRRNKPEATETVIVSIGRIFHLLVLNGRTITVTMYWPRYPYKHMNYHYTYRFQVPDSEKYDVSWTDFIYINLEHYNWNYVDGYLCTKGEDDFSLAESLKYWRSHLCLLPCNNIYTKKIIEGASRCDIYEQKSVKEQKELLHDFLRLVEMLNKIRRPTQTRQAAKKELNRRCSLASLPMLGGAEWKDPSAMKKPGAKGGDGTESPLPGSYIGTSNITQENLQKKVLLTSESATDLSVVSPAKPDVTDSPLLTRVLSDGILSIQSPHQEVIGAMLCQNSGLYFVKQQQQTPALPSLPNHCFIADEALGWVIERFVDIDNRAAATVFLQKLLDEQYIAHASGNRQHRFVPGFYLYCIVEDKKDFAQLKDHYNPNFASDWLEVSTHCSDREQDQLDPVDFLNEEPPQPLAYPLSVLYDPGTRIGQHSDGTSYRSLSSELTLDLSALTHGMNCFKTVSVDVDPSHKSDRLEWGMAHYHTNYCPTAAYVVTIQWLVATGCILGDLIQSWARKAGSIGFHLLPIPGDPFALPFTPGSDPLRGPIFVPLDIDCLKADGQHLFEAFNPDTREARLLRFQDSILRRFGFMPDMCPMKESNQSSAYDDRQPKYVHCTGGMFAMIPDTKTTSPRNKDGTHCTFPAGSFNDYIALQSDNSDCNDDPLKSGFYKIGFLWSWNYMLAKRWRSANTGDEAFQDRMLADFRKFCSNSDNRLVEYWRDCQLIHAARTKKSMEDATAGEAEENLDSQTDESGNLHVA